jgi:hypothetical protein
MIHQYIKNPNAARNMKGTINLAIDHEIPPHRAVVSEA